ncbi:MAG: MaoC/PaaZ C-terminal domain-containing protein, partial [Syntrophothermus sp.]
MPTRTLTRSPQVLPLYARAAAPLVPGASLLPFVPGGSDEIPDLELELSGAVADPVELAAYARVCGFALRDRLPPTFPHVLAFPLQMAVLADGSFPFGAVGLVHLANRIVQHRPIAVGEELTIHVRPTPLRPHPKGRTFDLQTIVFAGEELVWDEVSTMLRRGRGVGGAISEQKIEALAAETPAFAEWRLAGDLGRRYGAVSGDRNPIHLHPLCARPLGFPGAIAHGMWTKARCLAALEPRLPDAFAVEVRFRRPIVLPARVELACSPRDGR